MGVTEINKLRELDFNKQLAFAFLTCERFYPNYFYFSQNYNFGDPFILREAIDFVYGSIFQPINLNQQKLDHLLSAVFNNIPDTNNFTTFYATIAMYSGGIIYESTNLVKHSDIDRILHEISTMAIDAVDCFIQVRDDMNYDDENFEEKILNDPLMRSEIAIQKGVIDFLIQSKDIDLKDIETLLRLQESNKRGDLIL